MYWADRINKQNEFLYDKTVYDTDKQLAKYYLSAQKRIQSNIGNLYDTLLKEATNGEIKINDLYKYDRYFELMNNINKELTKLGHSEIKIYEKQFLLMYDFVQQNISKEAPTAIAKTFVASGQADEILKAVWCSDGKHWSDRVWANKQKLQEMLEKGLVDCVVRGVPKDELVKTIKSNMGSGFFQSDRIVRTEMTFVQNQATVNRYSVAGVKYYKILAANDSRTSEICKKQDGKIYEMDKAQVGINLPPFHPNCRSTIIPVLED